LRRRQHAAIGQEVDARRNRLTSASTVVLPSTETEKTRPTP